MLLRALLGERGGSIRCCVNLACCRSSIGERRGRDCFQWRAYQDGTVLLNSM